MDFREFVKVIGSDHRVDVVVDFLGYVPCGVFGRRRVSSVLDRLGDADAIGLARDVAAITGSPVKVAAAWVYSHVKGVSPRSPRNRFLVHDPSALSVMFERDEVWRPLDLDEVIRRAEDVRSAFEHDARVRWARLLRR